MTTIKNNYTKEEKKAFLGSLIEDCKECKRCGLHRNGKARSYPRTLFTGEVNVDSTIMILMDSFYNREPQEPYAATDTLGRVIEDGMYEMGLSNYLYYTPLVKCASKKGNEEDAILACSAYLKAEIRIIKPRLLVATSKKTLEALKMLSLSKGPYSRYEDTDLSIPIYNLCLPTSLTPDSKKDFVEELELFKRFYYNIAS